VRTFTLILLILTGSSALLAQDGTPFITHFRGSNEFEVQNWSICQDDKDIMLFANRKGLLSYDGNRWDIRRLPYTLFDLKKNPDNNVVYAGANDDYGFLERNSLGNIEYHSLLPDSIKPGIITSIIFADSTIIFYSDKSITCHNLYDPQVFKRWFSEDEFPFTGIIVTDENMFFNVKGKGLNRIDSDTLFPIVTGYLTQNSEILFTLPYDESRLLIGTSLSELRLFDGIMYYDYTLSDNEYLGNNILSDGIVISDSLYVFSTLYGGILLVNRKDGEILNILNYQNGLPDDEIYAIGSDNNNGLWLTHGQGISRVDIGLPLSDFSNYPGLEGFVIGSLWYNDRLYVATNEGLFILDEVRNYDEVEVLYKLPPRRDTPSAPAEVQPEEVQRSSLKKVFSRLFSKKETREAAKITDEKVVPVAVEPRYEKKTISTLISIDWLFRKLDGISSRTNQLIGTGNGILAVTSSGLYNIIDQTVSLVSPDRFINGIFEGSGQEIYYLATDHGICSVKYSDEAWIVSNNLYGISEPVYAVSLPRGNLIWAGSNNKVYQISISVDNQEYQVREYLFESDYPVEYRIDCVNSTQLAFSETGILYYSATSDSFIPYNIQESLKEDQGKNEFILTQSGYPWIKINNEWKCLNISTPNKDQLESIIRLFGDVISITSTIDNEYWVVDNESHIYRIENSEEHGTDTRFNLFVNNITNEAGDMFNLSNLVFEPYDKAITLNLAAPYFLKETSTQYQYYIEDMMINWSRWTNTPDISLFLESGKYVMHLRARNILGKISEEKTIRFTIKPPFTKTSWFYILIGLAGFGLLYLFVNIRERKLRHDKMVLEQKVKERTAEIEQKKEQIEEQRDEIIRQKEEITDSITYASRIQDAILPSDKILKKCFKEHFIIYKPRDIVSGDFYWITETRDKVYFAVADCTGHGVPGAIMSMLSISLLTDITGEADANYTSDQMLNLLREKVISSLKQSGREEETKDGLDIALCVLSRKGKVLEYSGAFNSLYFFRDGKFTEYKADRMPIGYHLGKSSFTRHEVKLKKNDVIYLFSDGYYDQFGGPDEKRFSSKNLKILLTGISGTPMDKQKEYLEQRFIEWKGENEQVDDIVIMGIRF